LGLSVTPAYPPGHARAFGGTLTLSRPIARSAGLAAIAIGLFALYLATRSFVHGWDSLAYTARAHDDALLGERYLSLHLLHPHHLLYLPLARAFTSLLARGTPDPFLPLQAFSALCAAVAALVFGLAVERRAGPARAAFVAAGVGLAYGTWRYGSDVEVMTPALAALAFAVLALARGREPHWTGAGVALAVATGLHTQLAAFALAAVAIVMADWARARSSARHAARMLAGWVLPTAVMYAVAAAALAPRGGPARLASWFFAAANRAEHFSSPQGLAAVLSLGAIGALVPSRPLSDLRWSGALTPGILVGALVATMVVVGAGVLCALAWPGLRRAIAGHDPLTRVLVAGVIALAVAIWAFEPWNEEYWVYVPPLVIVLLALHLPAGVRAVPRLVFGLVAGLMCLGLAYVWWPRRDPKLAPYASAVAFADSHLERSDIVLAGPATSDLKTALLAIPLLSGVDVLSTPDPSVPGEVEAYDRAVRVGLARHAVVVTSEARADAARAAGPGWQLVPFGSIDGRPIARLEPVTPDRPDE